MSRMAITTKTSDWWNWCVAGAPRFGVSMDPVTGRERRCPAGGIPHPDHLRAQLSCRLRSQRVRRLAKQHREGLPEDQTGAFDRRHQLPHDGESGPKYECTVRVIKIGVDAETNSRITTSCGTSIGAFRTKHSTLNQLYNAERFDIRYPRPRLRLHLPGNQRPRPRAATVDHCRGQRSSTRRRDHPDTTDVTVARTNLRRGTLRSANGYRAPQIPRATAG